MSKKNLAEEFGTPATAASRAGLQGLLPPRGTQPTPSPRPVAEPQADPQPTTDGEDSATLAEPATAPPQRGPRSSGGPARRLRPAPAAQQARQSYQVPVYVLPSVKTAAQQRRVRDRVTNAELAFDAIDALRSELGQILQSRRTVPRSSDSLFPARRAAKRNVDVGARRVLWSIQATADEIKVLDDLVTELGADSRSELIAAAIEARLLRR